MHVNEFKDNIEKLINKNLDLHLPSLDQVLKNQPKVIHGITDYVNSSAKIGGGVLLYGAGVAGRGVLVPAYFLGTGGSLVLGRLKSGEKIDTSKLTLKEAIRSSVACLMVQASGKEMIAEGLKEMQSPGPGPEPPKREVASSPEFEAQYSRYKEESKKLKLPLG